MKQHSSPVGTPISRRVVLKGGAAVMISAVLPVGIRDALAATGTLPPPFLNESERTALAAVVDRMIPADHEPGALAANCARYIDAFLGAFTVDPPFIYAGGPFSDRAGHDRNHFTEFLPLDEYDTIAWRLVLEGSRGERALEFNGPVKGVQEVYRAGLARLNARAQEFGADDFASLPPPAQDQLLNDGSDPVIVRLVDMAYLDTMNGMYGPPEYGGNEGLLGWSNTAYPGDVQPTGYTDEQVIHADNPGPFDATLPPSFSEGGSRQAPVRSSQQNSLIPRVEAERIAASLPATRGPIASITSQEVMSSVIADAEGSLSRLRQILKPYADQLRAGD